MSNRIIGGKRYILEKRNLLCEVGISNSKSLFDLFPIVQRLYYPHGKAFVLETVKGMIETTETRIISKAEAMQFLDEHPEGIKEKVYVRYFGEPDDV